MDPKYTVALVGSTGAVGEEFLDILEERNFPIGKLILLASKRSVGKKQVFKNTEYLVEELTPDIFRKQKVDLAFFSVGSELAKSFAPLVSDTGCLVIDNSSAFRMDKKVPLIVPEINPEDISKHKGIIANPNCSTIIMLMPLAPIHRLNPIKKIVVSTYQAASGAGVTAMEELRTQAKEFLDSTEISAPKSFPYPIAFNCFSHDSKINLETGYNIEEYKMIQESHKILKNDTIEIVPTCIRVSVFRAHAESIYLELENEINLTKIRQDIEAFPGLSIIDDRKRNYFPMPLESTKKDEIFVGRLRQSISAVSLNASSRGHSRGLNLWCCGDQLRKGAALNAVQIAEKVFV